MKRTMKVKYEKFLGVEDMRKSCHDLRMSGSYHYRGIVGGIEHSVYVMQIVNSAGSSVDSSEIPGALRLTEEPEPFRTI
ncbi:hypothetical protein Trydic_g4660 [Trypoxylus dichotomus]